MSETTIAWEQMASYFPNIQRFNPTHAQMIQVKQSLSAPRLRLLVTNRFSSLPLVITHLTVAATVGGEKAVTLAKQTTFTISAGQDQWTDWVKLPVVAGDWLTIEIISPTTSPQTLMQTLDQSVIKLASLKQDKWFGVAAVAVQTARPKQQLLLFGDSLTNQGYYSAALSQLLWSQQPDQWGVINGGISGNRLLRPGHSTSVWSPSFGAAGLARFSTLLTEQPIDHVIFMAGINDLLHPGTGSPMAELPTADALLAGFRQVQRLADQTQIVLQFMTITPFKGSMLDNHMAWTPQKEAIRQTVNLGLLENANTIDIAKFVAESADPQQLATEFDCGDHIHFSPVGGRQVAKYILNHWA